MEQKQLAEEQRRLTETAACMDGEYDDLAHRLQSGIEAADPATVEYMTDQFLRRLRVLDLVRDKPYFARIDFTPEGGAEDRLYIGKTTLIDGDTNVLVVDWRAPVASLYYEGRTGDAAYTCPDGEIRGKLRLKRQFRIEKRRLLEYSDIDVTFDEELLRPYLEVGSDTRLKNIIATIQAEQNRIIRAPIQRPLIVQGAAGSGKTTVALHRIAYLIYTYAQRFRPSEFLIIAPNALFLDYISNVLPDLGVEDVRQQTFEALVQQALHRKLKIEDPGEKLARLLSLGEEKSAPLIEAARYRSSLRYRDAIDAYLRGREESFVPRADFCAGAFVLCPYEGIREMFLVEYRGESYERRLAHIKERLQGEAERGRAAVLRKIDADRDKKLARLRETKPDAAAFRREKQAIYSEHEQTVRDLMNGCKAALRAYLKLWALPPAVKLYGEFLADGQALAACCEGLSDAARECVAQGRRRTEYEDLAALLHIRYRIAGAERALAVRHAVIDEAQDFSEFQFFALTETLACTSFTILGDLAQGIYWYRGTDNWRAVMERVFPAGCGLLTLEKSYRSTVEIMEKANDVLGRMRGLEVQKAQPVIRHGEPVAFRRVSGAGEQAEAAARRVAELKAQGMENIALICRAGEDCARLYPALAKGIPGLRLLESRQGRYAGGVSLAPSYLVKGLEFDAVLLLDAQQFGTGRFDTHLLYVALTRAMHRLDVFCQAESIPAGGLPEAFAPRG